MAANNYSYNKDGGGVIEHSDEGDKYIETKEHHQAMLDLDVRNTLNRAANSTNNNGDYHVHTGSEKPGMKFDKGKLEWDLIPWEALENAVLVLMDGAVKYDRWNWIKVENGKMRYLNAAMRHLFKHARGEFVDPESGRPHISHALVNLIFLNKLHLEEK